MNYSGARIASAGILAFRLNAVIMIARLALMHPYAFLHNPTVNLDKTPCRGR